MDISVALHVLWTPDTGGVVRSFSSLGSLRACACTCSLLAQVSCLDGAQEGTGALIIRRRDVSASNAATVSRVLTKLCFLQVEGKVHDVANLRTKTQITLKGLSFAECLFLGAALAGVDMCFRVPGGKVLALAPLRARADLNLRLLTQAADLAAIFGALSLNPRFPSNLQAEIGHMVRCP